MMIVQVLLVNVAIAITIAIVAIGCFVIAGDCK
jgi:hypothetical protein